MRSQFEKQLESLNVKLLKIGEMVQEIIEVAVHALAKQDLEKSKTGL